MQVCVVQPHRPARAVGVQIACCPGTEAEEEEEADATGWWREEDEECEAEEDVGDGVVGGGVCGRWERGGAAGVGQWKRRFRAQRGR